MLVLFLSFQVGLSLAQIGEFAFVLLSRASNLHLVEVIWIIPYGILNLVCANSSSVKFGIVIWSKASPCIVTELFFCTFNYGFMGQLKS